MILLNSVSQFLHIGPSGKKTLYGPIGKALAHNRICFLFAKVLFSSTLFKKKFKNEVD